MKKSVDYELVAADYSSISKSALANATTKEDTTFAKAVASQKAFNQWVKPQDYLPALLKSKFAGLGNGSSAMITLNTVTVAPELVQSLTGIANYQLTKSDYANPLVDWFTPERLPQQSIPSILLKQFPEAAANEYRLVKYNYSEEEPNIESVRSSFFGEDFENGFTDKGPIDQNGWTQYFVKGTKFKWQARTSPEGLGAQFSSYNSGEDNEAWLISPEVDLTTVPDGMLTFDVRYAYSVKDHKPLTVMVSDNYSEGDVTTAKWTDITSLFTYPNETNTTLHSAGEASLSNFTGKKVRIAFVYTGSSLSTPALTTTVLIDNIDISRVQLTAIPQAEVIPQNAVYMFNGTKWSLFTSGKLSSTAINSTPIYSVQIADYTEMGESGPGKNDYFSSSILPANYLPQFLSMHFPYAQIGDQRVLVYQYGNISSNTADLYTLDSMRVWKPLSALTVSNEQYLNIGTGWIFDPTITFNLLKSDYQVAVDWVIENKGEQWLDYRYVAKRNSEMWFGASAYYGNLDFTLSLRRSENCDPEGTLAGLSDDEAINLFHTRVKDEALPAILKARYPDAPATTSGVTQYYQVIYLVYPERANYMVRYEGLGNGEFKYIEGPSKQ